MSCNSFLRRASRAPSLILVTLAACGGGGGGGATVPPPPNAPAVASEFAVLDTRSAPARLRIVVKDDESDPVTVTFLCTTPGAAGGPFPLVGVPHNPVTLATSPGGIAYEIPWNFPAEAALPDDASFVGGVTVIARVAGGDRTTVSPLGNDAPVLQVGAVPVETRGTVDVGFALRDSGADRCDVKVEYHDVGDPSAPWRLARPAGLLPGDATPAFAFPDVAATASPSGFVFHWDTDADLPDLDRTVQLRFTARDRSATGAAVVTASFRIDNNGEPAAAIDETAMLAAPDRANGLPIPFRVADDEGDPARVVFQWRFASDPAFVPLDTTDPGALAAQLRDPGFRASHRVCTPYHPSITAGFVPLDATHVRLPRQSADLVGRDIEILRTRPAFQALAGTWPNNPLRAPVAMLPSDGGIAALVLEEVGTGAELVELELATGVVRRTVAQFAGAPTAMVTAAAPGHVLVATDAAGQWRVHEVDVAVGVTTLRASRPATATAGPLRGIVPFGASAVLATAGSEVLSCDWRSGTPEVTTLRAGFAEPWGIVADPGSPCRVFVAERLAARVVAFDIVRRTSSPIGACDLVGLAPTSLAIDDTGTELAVLARPALPTGSALLALVDLGRASQTNLGVPADTASIGLGGDRAILLPQRAARNVLVRRGVEQRRRIVAFDVASASATLDAPLVPVPTARQTWRVRPLDPATAPVATAPAGIVHTFVWDLADVPSGEQVLVRAVPFDGEAGVASATATAIVRRDPLQTTPGPLTCAGPSALIAADLDGDGDFDLVAANAAIDRLSVFEQTAAGVFASVPLLVGSSGVSVLPRDVEAVDVDGDGDLDLVAVTANGVLVFVQTAPLVFAPPQRIDPPGFPAGLRIAAADLDGDGDVDFATANSTTAAVFFQVAPMTFSAPVLLDVSTVVPGAIAVDVAIGDLDGDGDLDVAVGHRNPQAGATQANGVVVFRQTAAQTFASPSALTLPRQVASVRVADVDGDGGLDLVTADRAAAAGKLGVFHNASFSRVDVTLDGAVDPTDVVAADLDGDGDDDLVCTNRATDEVLLVHQVAPGVFSSHAVHLGGVGVTNGPAALVVADLDGDGRVDLACANDSGGSIAVMLQRNGRFFATPAGALGDTASTPQPNDVVIGRFAADGKPGIAVVNGGNASSVAVFAPQPLAVTLPLANASAAAVGDLDADGDDDLVVAHGASPGVTLVRQTAPGQFTVSPLLGSGAGWNMPTGVAVADLDGDGDDDVVVVEQGGIALSFQQAPGTFTAPLRLLANVAPDVAPLCADLDGDGDVDIAVPTANAVLVWRQVAPGTFAAPLSIAVPGAGNPPRALAAADVDGDGLVDIVSANGADVTIFRQAAPGSFASPVVLSGANNTAIVALDFDGDGDQDLAVVRGGQLLLLQQTSALVFATPRLLGGAGLVRLAVADLDGDGDPDLVATDPAALCARVFFGGR